MSSAKRESIAVLEECIDLQVRKSQDYQNPNSNIVQSMHYRRGVSTIHDMIHQKLLRAQSLLEPMENGETRTPNFESLEDTYKDLINYASFAVAYIRGRMEGQTLNRDMLNRKKEWTVLDEIVETVYDPAVHDHIVKLSIDDVGQIEDDGFITYTRDERPVEEKVKEAYATQVYPKGEVSIPRGQVNCTDPVQHAYVKKVKRSQETDVKDVIDRIEEDMSDHREAIRRQGK